jgi:beta-galactosidase GanA
MQNKHLLLFSYLLLLTLLALGCSRSAVESRERAETSSAAIPAPAWLKDEPLIIVGNWDSMSIFRRRVGGNPTWQEDDYQKEHSEETVRKLKELGVTLAVIHFYKGFGLEAEKEHLEYARKLTSLLKKYGIRVGVYIGSTIAYETFLLEQPEAESWFVPDYMGRPVFYSEQTFRKRVYFMHPGYREYMKRVLRLAVEELKVDEIDFDNTSMQAHVPIFHHPMAVQDFRDFLRTRYAPETLKKRLGFTNVQHVLPPAYDRPLGRIDDPLFQEWADFRCQQLNNYYAELAQFIRGLNPNVAIATNPHSGISGRNTVWEQGVDYPGLVPHMDIVWTEEGNEATVTPDGVLVSKIRTYKMATSLNRRVITYTAGGRGGRLQMAESMAFNRQGLGMVGGVLAGYDLPTEQRTYIDFFTGNFEHYRDVDNIADVAVLHSHSTMGFNNDRPWQSAMLFEQALIQAQIPFDIVFDDQLRDLSKYRVLVLPDQECLSDAQLDLIREFVTSGGGLVATEHTSLYTEWRQRRRDFGLKDLFQVAAPRWASRRAPEKLLDIGAVKNQVGRGRAVYLAEVRPAVEKPPTARMTSEYWKLPVNWKELVSAVEWAAGERLSIEVKAPQTVVAELIEQRQDNKLLVHLLNYDVGRTPEVRNIGVSLRVPDGKKVSEVSLLSPDEATEQAPSFTVKEGRVVFTVPRLETYTLAIVRLS